MFPGEIFKHLEGCGIDCFYGVPDSLLKNFCAYITDHAPACRHIITANEGNAIALAAGHYLATGRPACVYMQNSGLGNCVNPLLSLVDGEVYNIPLLLLIGWRGEPGVKDEPQHAKQGKVTSRLLDAMDIRHAVLARDFPSASRQIDDAVAYMCSTGSPFAFMVQKGTFDDYSLVSNIAEMASFPRELAIGMVLDSLAPADIVVGTTGHISREIYEWRNYRGQTHAQDFLTVGSMGHASSIAFGIAQQHPTRKVFCLDGDGAFLMHMGAAVLNASQKLQNFRHVIFNNRAHDSVGGQPTATQFANFPQIAIASGYDKAWCATNAEELRNILPQFMEACGTAFLEIRVKRGARADLGRPKEKPVENKLAFMEHLRHAEFLGRGSLAKLGAILKAECVTRVLAFTGHKSFADIQPFLLPVLSGYETTFYNDFSVNPRQTDVDRAISSLSDTNFDIILAIGGGSVLDFAKAYRFHAKKKLKLIAIPTTFGSGAESTRFAVVYVDGKKTSLEDSSLLPDYAIVDSTFARSNSRYLKACTGMDTLCQAIESLWSLQSTPQSRVFAEKALVLCRDNIIAYVNTDEVAAADSMARAAHLAGKAINISRTTAAHALSYAFTSEYGIPHGHAVSLTIARIFAYNAGRTGEISDPRGTEFVQAIMKRLKELISPNPCAWFDKLFAAISLECDFGKLGIDNLVDMFSRVNTQRLANNPKHLDVARLLEICTSNT